MPPTYPARYIPLLILFCFSTASLYLNPQKGVPFSLFSLVLILLYFLNKFWLVFCAFIKPLTTPIQAFSQRKIQCLSISNWIQFCLLGLFISWTLYGIIDSPVRLRAIAGYFFLLFIAFFASTKPRGIRLRPVIGGLVLQLLVGTLFLKWEPGAQRLRWLVDKAVAFMDLTFHGSEFVYGMAAKPPVFCGSRLSIFFNAFQIIVFFGAFVSLLYHLGVIQLVLQKMALLVRITMGTSAVESLNAVACIFIGQTEASLLISKSLPSCSRSELHSIMTAGYACIAGSLFSVFISFGACPSYLLVSTIMSAAVSLSISKIVYPEEPHGSNEEVHFSESEASSVLESISIGATKSSWLVVVIGSVLVVTFAILSFINGILSYCGYLLGYDFLSVNWLMTQTFYPLAYLMGASDAIDPEIASRETAYVAELMGIKTAVNEFMAFIRLSELIKSGQLVGARARMIGTFVSTGFSNISMLGNMLAIMTSLAPSKKEEIVEVIVRALLCGCISCFLSATVAGIIVDEPIVCDPTTTSSLCVDINRAIEFLKNQTTN